MFGPHAMSIMPSSREGRWRLAFFPFKVYTIAVPLVAILSIPISNLAGWNDLGNVGLGAGSVLADEQANRYAILEYGYLVCIVGLLIGASCQPEKRARRSALIFALVAVVLLVLLYPATQVAHTRSL
jgi:hypothetical protein